MSVIAPWLGGSDPDCRSELGPSRDRSLPPTWLFSKFGKKALSVGLLGEDEDVEDASGSCKCCQMTETSGRRLYEKFLGPGLENDGILGLI